MQQLQNNAYALVGSQSHPVKINHIHVYTVHAVNVWQVPMKKGLTTNAWGKTHNFFPMRSLYMTFLRSSRELLCVGMWTHVRILKYENLWSTKNETLSQQLNTSVNMQLVTPDPWVGLKFKSSGGMGGGGGEEVHHSWRLSRHHPNSSTQHWLGWQSGAHVHSVLNLEYQHSWEAQWIFGGQTCLWPELERWLSKF